MKLTYKSSDDKATIIATIVTLSQNPETTFHFNLTALNGKINDPVNMSVYRDKITTAEYLTVMRLFKNKATFYIKSGSIYKPVTVK